LQSLRSYDRRISLEVATPDKFDKFINWEQEQQLRQRGSNL
jgi:hypothetical protein